MNFNANDFKIVHGCTLDEIEQQVKALKEQGYSLHGTPVAQPNPHYSSTSTAPRQPFLYYQMLAKNKQAVPKQEPESEGGGKEAFF